MKTRKNKLIGLTVGGLSRSFTYEPLAVLRAIRLPALAEWHALSSSLLRGVLSAAPDNSEANLALALTERKLGKTDQAIGR